MEKCTQCKCTGLDLDYFGRKGIEIKLHPFDHRTTTVFMKYCNYCGGRGFTGSGSYELCQSGNSFFTRLMAQAIDENVKSLVEGAITKEGVGRLERAVNLISNKLMEMVNQKWEEDTDAELHYDDVKEPIEEVAKNFLATPQLIIY
jgi:arsenate reductase-like glutaredoxin family protein